MKMVLWTGKHLESKAGDRVWLHIISNEDLVLSGLILTNQKSLKSSNSFNAKE